MGVSIDISLSSLTLSLPVQHINKPIRGILHFGYSVFNFWHLLLFLKISISLLIVPIFSHMLSTFPVRTFSIVIVVVLNS